MSIQQLKSSAEHRTLDNQVRVSTPENIAFQYEITGPTRRMVAYLADVLITMTAFIAMFFLLILAIVLVSSGTGTAMGAMGQVVAEMAGLLILLLAFLSLWFYGAYMETNYNGQTLGKMLTNIRTISTNGSAIDGIQATLRNFFRLMDVFPVISLGLIFGPEVGYIPFIPIFAFGLISMALSPKFQRIGDYVADTIVVTEDKKWVHALASFPDPRVAELAELLPDSFVVPATMARALAEFVDRRRVLPLQRVNEIAGSLARPLMEQFDLPTNTDPDLLLCSLYFKTFVSKQEETSSTSPFSALEKLAKSEALNANEPVQGGAS